MATTTSGLQTATGAAGTDQVASESRVDRDSHFNGLYKTKQNLRIEGIAEGEIQCDGTMMVAEGARVKAKVTASTVTIAGELEGDVICRGTFQIMPSGQVQATVSARRLVVHEGGFYNGEFHMITDAMSAGEDLLGKLGMPAGDTSKAPATADLESTEDWWAKLTNSQATPEEPDKTPG